jgi:predicted RNase H-like HicB family nuclease
MRDYHINIFYSEEDSSYIADIPDLPYCAAFGESPQEALAEVLKAKAVWIEAAKAEGKPIPPPSFKPVIYHLAEART